ncbi:nucleotide sugar dehydrogenase [Halobacillus trueperi]|uniref:Nucleotide sugar dehydrogenase n=1 Tax=Halobacillus trueperi TaxID=156205 RepID=A0A3D8VR12_9BACI|nr:nucleotide sugar dehydrogenase [Halobacillus trueperi]RDY71697.1 nucleotide sugar dehydrogenase [Halobacillus trueperi]
MENKDICVMGLGYIGLPTAAMFAKNGHKVLGVDVKQEAVDLLNKGEIHIEEVGLGEMVKEVVSIDNLVAATKPSFAETFIIAVPTPFNDDYSANLDYVVSATKSIIPYTKKGNVVIVESTIPPRTIDDVIVPLFEEKGLEVGKDVYLAHCPERVLPGRILTELVENTRIVGGYNEISASKAADVYRTFVTGDILETTAISAEMSKLLENTYRDVNIALANELAKVSEKIGVNALEVIELANHHPRVNLHQPGPGVGGHCLAVDPYFIIEKAPEETKLISNARKINNSMPSFVVEQVEKLLGDREAKLTVLGLSYKGNIDDVRESPAMEIVNLLQEKKYNLSFYDPHVKQAQVKIPLAGTLEDAISEADCVLVLTDHDEFKSLKEEKLKSHLKKNCVVLDTRNCLNISVSDIKYYNYSNLYQLNRENKVLVP